MIKIKNAMHSNLFFGTVIFMGFLLTWGCSKNVAPPEVEEPLAPVLSRFPKPSQRVTLHRKKWTESKNPGQTLPVAVLKLQGRNPLMKSMW